MHITEVSSDTNAGNCTFIQIHYLFVVCFVFLFLSFIFLIRLSKFRFGCLIFRLNLFLQSVMGGRSHDISTQTQPTHRPFY